MDELWSFVDDKGNEQWVWLAMDVVTREVVGCYIGDRSGKSAQALWDSLPAVYRSLCRLPSVISGCPIPWRCRANDIGQSVNKQV
ncbi:MAG: hypothetical protein CLLPBCKN_008450 [Chroococcidiopsis cubana SAG 39.79]|nr:hypothetical protein [Chroococcidiopsis cubana SAG 39.79]MDZ4879012.1 hypothetical protein [Chroococcidiopsis cubana SAG 39.79]